MNWMVVPVDTLSPIKTTFQYSKALTYVWLSRDQRELPQRRNSYDYAFFPTLFLFCASTLLNQQSPLVFNRQRVTTLGEAIEKKRVHVTDCAIYLFFYQYEQLSFAVFLFATSHTKGNGDDFL